MRISDWSSDVCSSDLEEPRGLVVIALGKLGSFELNYSSDIDPILIFDPATLPRRSRDDPDDAAVRIAPLMVEILSARTGDRHVLLVDLRLLPPPPVPPTVLPDRVAAPSFSLQPLSWEPAALLPPP